MAYRKAKRLAARTKNPKTASEFATSATAYHAASDRSWKALNAAVKVLQEEAEAAGRFAEAAETFGLEHGFEAVRIGDRRVTTEYIETTGRIELLHLLIDEIRERSHAITSPRAQWQSARDVLGDLDTSELPQIGDL
jgi:hypothetical protein